MLHKDITAILLNDDSDYVLGKENLFFPGYKLQNTVIKANLKAALFKGEVVQVKIKF